jgi:catechol 2,3-dioxygenase-like lactoylglutathione lyase family enzyme
MNLSLSHCFILVSDSDEALAFYRDVLGLELKGDVNSEAGRWITLVAPAHPELEIVLTEPHSGRSAEDGDALLRILTKGSLNNVMFRADDLDAVFEKVAASGAEVLQEPTDQFWGVRDAAFRDPSGNMIRISQAPAGP